MKSRSREIGCYNGRIALKCDRHLGSAAVEVPVKFQNEWKSANPNLAASRLTRSCRKMSTRLVNKSPRMYRSHETNHKVAFGYDNGRPYFSTETTTNCLATHNPFHGDTQHHWHILCNWRLVSRKHYQESCSQETLICPSNSVRDGRTQIQEYDWNIGFVTNETNIKGALSIIK